jgi:glutamine synthetase
MTADDGLAMGMETVPSSLGEAIDALERDDVLLEALGTDFAKSYLEIKREEWHDYVEMLAKTVTPWEIQRYLGC